MRWTWGLLWLVACGDPNGKDPADDTDIDSDSDPDTPEDTDESDTPPDDTDDSDPSGETDETDETDLGETDRIGETDETDLADTEETDPPDTGPALPDARALNPGDLVITELMIFPTCVNDDAEYIELYYRGAAPIDLFGLTLADAGATWTMSGHYVARPGDTVLMWRQPLPGRTQCYGFGQGLVYASPISLSNTGDTIWLDDPDGERIDLVDYRGWTIPNGASLQLDPAHNDSNENDDPALWCASTTALTPPPDLGSPGLPNLDCPGEPVDTDADTDPDTDPDTDADTDPDTDPDSDSPPPGRGDLILSEVVDWGPNADLRYIEVCNPGPGEVNLLGWSLHRYSNGGTNPANIALTGVTLAAGDAYVVAASQGDPATWLATFGVEPDQQSGNVSSNGDDAWTLSYDDGTGDLVVDVYGEVGVDGTNTAWEYEDAAASRLSGGPSTTWIAEQWLIRADEAGATPGSCAPPEPLPVDTDTDTGGDSDTDTDLPDPPRGVLPGELVINGVLADPALPCSDGDGEWFSFVNVSSETLDLDGLVISDASRSVVWSGTWLVPPGAEVVAWPTPATTQCHGLLDGLVYDDALSLNNSSETVRLSWGGQDIDVIQYGSQRTGVARELDPRHYDAATNDGSDWWCDASTPIGATADLGTPGGDNLRCDFDTDLPVESDPPVDTDLPVDTAPADTDLPVDTDPIDTDPPVETDPVVDTDTSIPVPPRGVLPGELVINGVLANPASPCADEDGEWVTFVNVSAETLDLEGLVFEDAASSSMWTTSLLVPPGAEVIAWRSPRSAQCHGFVDGITWSAGLSLNNSGGDTVRLRWGGALIDEVSYPSTSADEGEAWELDRRHLDATENNDDALWCETVTPIAGSADFGTPGTPNGRCNLGRDTGPARDTTDSAAPPDTVDTDALDTAPLITPKLILTEIADPEDSTLRFVEITNLTGSSIDTDGWSVVRYSNGNIMGTPRALDPMVLSDRQTIVMAFDPTAFAAAFGFVPDMSWGGLNQNGNDAFALTLDQGSGPVIVDVFGEIGVDGTGTDWEYTDRSALRVPRPTLALPRPSAVFDLRDWYIRRGRTLTPGWWEEPFEESAAPVRVDTTDSARDTADTADTADPTVIDTQSNDSAVPVDTVDSADTGDTGDTDLPEPVDTDTGPAGPGHPVLFISELADPAAEADAKYLEIYNAGDVGVDLSRWEIGRYSNGSTTGVFRTLPAVRLRAGEVHVVAFDEAAFTTFFGRAPDSEWSGINGNGNDVYTLYERAAGRARPYDIYGQLGVDGLGLPWYYGNAVATRREGVTGPSSRFSIDEWAITFEGFTPGVYAPAPAGGLTDTFSFDTGDEPLPTDTGLHTDVDTDTTVDTGPTGVLLLSEIADPVDFTGRYIEVYNAGPGPVDLRGWGVQIYSNGGTQPTTHPFPAFDLQAGETWVVAASGPGFSTLWGFDADDLWGSVTGSGNDVYTLVERFSGRWIVVDVYGEIGTDGAGQPWEYTDQTAWRHADVTTPTDAFDIRQWTISPDPLLFTPDIHPSGP